MSDATVIKVDVSQSPHGPNGQKYLASSKSISMRLWKNIEPSDSEPEVRRDCETVGYVLSGRPELHLESQDVVLEAGNSCIVPKNASYTYKILESFHAIEATHPPEQFHGRDE